jgi:aryl-alcohol dehydrogenase-like predicted oxidoreductase
MTFGDEWGPGSAKDEAGKVYDAFHKAGGNFIDTANFYVVARCTEMCLRMRRVPEFSP